MSRRVLLAVLPLLGACTRNPVSGRPELTIMSAAEERRNYRGKRHPFKISGLTAVGVGASRQDATGEVYNLKKLDDFEGTYTSIEASGAVGGGAGIATMRSAKGVRITLHSASQGVAAQAGPEGIKITLAH